MFCNKCGKEINNDAQFCPFCGTTVQKSAETECTNYVKKSGAKKWIAPLLIAAVIILIIAFPIRFAIEKAIVKSVAEDKLQMIKDGPSEEIMDEVLVTLLYEVTDNELITDFLHKQITGEDVKDVYIALMRHMSYKVMKVERVDSTHYRIIVHIENLNNVKVASDAWGSFKERYKGMDVFDALSQAKADISSDKSLTIASYLTDASDRIYKSEKIANTVAGNHVILAAKEGDEWTTSFEEGIETFLLNCAGIEYK